MQVLTNQTIVIDNGSGSIKAGMAGLTKPRCLIPSYQGFPKHPPSFTRGAESKIFVGSEAEKNRGLLRLEYPMKHGIVTDWDIMERLWTQVYTDLQAKSDEHSVLLTEAAMNPTENRRRIMEVFFDQFRVPAFFISIQAVLSLYASARTCGIVLDVGDGVSHVVPVMEGFALVHSVRRSDIAGRDVTEFLSLLLRRAGTIFHTSAEMEIVRQIKESTCYLAYSSPKDDFYRDAVDSSGARDKSSERQYQLPDGATITLGAERRIAPEILFTPRLIGSEYPGVHELLSSSINRTDMELRRQLSQEIVLSGGSTLLSTFVDRILFELRKLRPKDSLVRVYAPPERQLSTFVGGSILASLPSFQQLWVTRAMYDEEGSSALLRRAF